MDCGRRWRAARALLEEEESRGGSEISLGRPGWDEVVRYDKAAMARTPRMAGTWHGVDHGVSLSKTGEAQSEFE